MFSCAFRTGKPARLKQFLLHIGYPKTGTTTLQKWLFPEAAGCRFVGKTGLGRVESEVIDRFRTLVNYGSRFHVDEAAGDLGSELVELVTESAEPSVLASLEGLTNPFADTLYVLPKDTYAKLDDIARILEGLAKANIGLKVLVTMRDQTAILPSLYTQIYLQSYATGLFRPDYDSFLDFMFGNDILGFGPAFFFDRVLDRCVERFGDDAVYPVVVRESFRNHPRDLGTLASFLGVDDAFCSGLLENKKSSFPRAGSKRYMVTVSPAVNRLEEMSGLGVRAKAFGFADRLRIRRGRAVFWEIADRSSRIADYYAEANSRLAERYGMTF